MTKTLTARAMPRMATVWRSAMLVLLAGWLSGCGINNIPTYDEQVKAAWSQVENQYQRRADLIPNLVETAKSYMSHERETLEAVIQARNQAQQSEQAAAANPDDANAIKQLIGAEGVLSGAMGRMFALMENYPDLKANQNMMQLSEELTSTENKVAFARQAFNDATTMYNTYRESFPSNVIAGMFNFNEAQLFEIEDSEQREVPKVSFS